MLSSCARVEQIGRCFFTTPSPHTINYPLHNIFFLAFYSKTFVELYNLLMHLACIIEVVFNLVFNKNVFGIFLCSYF